MRPTKFWLLLLPAILLLVSCGGDPTEQAKRYTENGNKFFDLGKYKEASIMYRRALQKDRLYADAYYHLGLTAIELGALGDAVENLRRAIDQEPNNADAMVKISDIYILALAREGAIPETEEARNEVRSYAEKLTAMDGFQYDGHRLLGQLALIEAEPEVAIQQLEAAEQAKPGQPGLGISYFQALVRANRLDEAEQVAHRVIESNPEYAAAYDLLYALYMQENRVDDASALLRSKVDNNQKNGDYMIQLAAHQFATKNTAGLDEAVQELADSGRYLNGHLLAGDFFMTRLRDFDRAEKEYEAGVEASPADQTLYQKRLVELYASTNRNAEANRMLTKVLEEDPNDTDAQAMRAALRLTTGNEDEVKLAVNELQSLVSADQDNHVLQFNLGRALLAQGNLSQATLALEKAVSLRPDFVQARVLLARLYLVQRDFAKALQAAEQVIALDPNNISAHLSRSTALLSLDERERAREELTYIIKNFPQNPDARYQVGLLAYQDKDYERASQIFGELHDETPEEFRGLVGVVETMAARGRMNEAVEEMRDAVQAEPDRRDLKEGLANLLVRTENYDDAIGLYREVLDRDPNAAAVLFRLAETYRRKGDLNNAEEYFQRSAEAAPNDPAPLLQLGLLLDSTGRAPQAEPIYEQVLRIAPENPVALNNLAFIKAQTGSDLDRALSMAQRATQAAPNNLEIKDTLGWIFIKKSLTEDAVRIFSDLVKADPQNPMYRYHYGMALDQKGDKPGARRELEAALQYQPSKDDETAIKSLLGSL